MEALRPAVQLLLRLPSTADCCTRGHSHSHSARRPLFVPHLLIGQAKGGLEGDQVLARLRRRSAVQGRIQKEAGRVGCRPKRAGNHASSATKCSRQARQPGLTSSSNWRSRSRNHRYLRKTSVEEKPAQWEGERVGDR